MAVQVHTNDSAALTDSDLDELASMDGEFGIGELSKAKEDWVLATIARIDGKLHGFMFSTLERIGGTPCVLIGLISVRRSSRRDQVLRGLMGEAYHRALMAFPDEDVVVGSRFVRPDAVDAFKELDDVTPSPGVRAVGEERAWGRRLAKRFEVEGQYDEKIVRRPLRRPGGLHRLRSRPSRRRSIRHAGSCSRRSRPTTAVRSSCTAGRWPRTSSSSAHAR